MYFLRRDFRIQINFSFRSLQFFFIAETFKANITISKRKLEYNERYDHIGLTFKIRNEFGKTSCVTVYKKCLCFIRTIDYLILILISNLVCQILLCFNVLPN